MSAVRSAVWEIDADPMSGAGFNAAVGERAIDVNTGILYVKQGTDPNDWILATNAYGASGAAGASTADAFVTIGHPADLTAERALTSSTTNAVSDGGANGSVTIDRAALTGDVTASAGSNATFLAGGSAAVLNSGTLLAARMPALTGDVTTSAGAVATTIANSAVTTTKMGGDVTTAGKALLDDADASAQRTTLGLGTLATQSGTFSGASSGTNTGDQTITLTGNVTGSGTGSFAATIANDAVTYAKMQNAGASSRLVGSGAAGAGADLAEIALGTNLSMSGTTLNAAGGSASMTAVTVTVAYGVPSATATVIDAAISGTSKIMPGWGTTAETDENTPAMCAVQFSAIPGTGQMTVEVSAIGADAVGGAYKLNYMVA